MQQVQQQDGYLQIQGEMSVQSAATLWSEAIAAVRSLGGEAILDLQQVSVFDTSGLQILLMLRRLALASGSRFCVLKPSHAVRQVLELCGLQDLIAADVETAP
jgi:anti-anti-sigma factor